MTLRPGLAALLWVAVASPGGRHARLPGNTGAGHQVVAAADDSLATVHGTVVAHAGRAPLADVTVSLSSGPAGTPGVGTRVTDDGGAFVFQDVPPGLYTLVVGLMGYLTRRDTVRVEAGADVEIVAELAVSPVPLEPIVVRVSRPASPAMRGFEQRRRTTAGSFITRQDVEAAHAVVLSDLLRRVPGARVVPTGVSGHNVLLRGGCQPALWIDGIRAASLVSFDLLAQPMDIEGIEVYRGPETPARFGTNSCGAIVIWTRRPERTGANGSIVKVLIVTAAVLIVGLIVLR